MDRGIGTDASVIAALARVIAASTDILDLAAALLRICRAHLQDLQRADADPDLWYQREQLRRRCERFFRTVDDEEIYSEERTELRDIASAWCDSLPPVMVAHVVVEALDTVLGTRFLPMFLDRRVTLNPGDPLPTPHPDWNSVGLANHGIPHNREGHLDATTHLCLAAEWAREVCVTLDGDWRTWHVLPQLVRGERLACAHPSRSVNELGIKRNTSGDQPVFHTSQGLDVVEQTERCLGLLDLARVHRCRVVVFPEFTLTESVQHAIRQWLDQQNVVDVVVAGRYHQPAPDGGWLNEAVLLIRGIERELVHRKFRPTSFTDSVGSPNGSPCCRREQLTVDVPTVTAYLSPCWTTVVLISNDAIQDPLPQLLCELRANLVLVPTFSFQMDAFRAAAERLARQTQGITLIANTCVGMEANSARPPAVIGMPAQVGKVLVETPPPCALFIATIGSLTQRPSFVSLDGSF